MWREDDKTINYLAIIPARSGSKGIKNKNVIKINDKESFRYTLEPLIESNIDKIFFSTDSLEYLNIYKKYYSPEKDVSFDYIRPDVISDNRSTTKEYIEDCLKFLKSKGYKINNFIILQPTSLFRTCNQINSIIDYHKSNNYNNVKSISPVIQTPYYMIYNDNTMVIPNNIKNRQEQKQVFILNGAYYVYSYEKYINNISSYITYNMTTLEGLDLDDETDLLLIESILKNKNK
tara:strand:- start:14 stop:712 length:699 start_codon:yes stop_codon:yes gene_type:complete